jgi:hypothetical protein
MAKKVGLLSLEDLEKTVPPIDIQEPQLINFVDGVEDNAMLDESDAVTIVLADDLFKKTEAVVALEELQTYLKTVDKNVKDDEKATFTNIAIEAMYDRAGIYVKRNIISLENYRKDPKAEMQVVSEDIKEKIRGIRNSIKSTFAVLVRNIAAKLNYFKRNLKRLKLKVSILERQANQLNRTGVPRRDTLVPNGWGTYLLYTESGFNPGMEDVGPPVAALLREHCAAVKKNTANLTNWLSTHYDRALLDRGVFSSLRISTPDYVIGNAKRLDPNTSINYTPLKDNSVYRSAELPGGMAFYTYMRHNDEMGINAVYKLGDMSYKLSYFNRSYYGIKKANPDMLANANFQTLSIAEINRSIKEIKDGIAALEEWYSTVVNHLWKNDKLDKISNDLYGFNTLQEPKNTVGTKYIMAMCSSIINYMRNSSIHIDSYAFKVYGNMLNYTELSLKQYK